ncbi:MAG: methyltransferase [Cytophagales bacterium]|nr:methyltransferase [Cytophagales bacterium]
MKVCTDSCVLGSYADASRATRILDIGTGTGLLALMLAQRTTAAIDAVELDEAAATQAAENAAASPWAGRIRIFHADIKAFAGSVREQYDFIVCNPPFFSQHLRRSQAAQNLAMHGDGLRLDELADVVKQLLQPDGAFWCLLPPHESTLLEQHCRDNGLHKHHELRLFDYTGGKQIRAITAYSFSVNFAKSTDLYIKTAANGTYTEAFTQLMKPYYLHL